MFKKLQPYIKKDLVPEIDLWEKNLIEKWEASLKLITEAQEASKEDLRLFPQKM